MAWPAGTVPDHEALIAKYRELASEGKREEIIKEADRIVEQSREVIREKPGTDEAIRARLNMALLYGVYGKGEFAEAEAIFTALIREHSDHALMPAVRYYYGKTIAVGWRAERWDEALKVFDGVARDYPKSEYAARATIERANWCRHLGEREEAKRREAIALYKRIVSKYPDTASGTESAYALFGLAMREHDLAEAKEWLDRIEKLHHPLAKENYALAYPRWAAADVFLNTTTLDEAVPVVTSALAAMTSDERTLEFLAALGEMNARAEEGEKRWDLIGYCLEEALATLEADTQPPVLLRLANLYASGQLGKARTDDGARLWEQLKQEHPASPEALEAALRLADYDRRRYEQFGRKPEDREWLQKAIAAYEEIVSKNPDSRHAAASLHALVALYLDEGDESRATSCLDRLAASTWPAAKGWYEEDRLRVLTRHVLKADAELGELQANIDRQLELLEEGDAKREFLWAIVRGSGALPEENGTRWHVVASCYETIVETASGEERTKAMFNLAQVYFYHHVGEDKPEKGIALLEQIKAEHAGQPWALRAEMAITGYLYHISWDVPRKKEARRDVLQRFLAIADKHAGSEEASRALFTLACHYTVREYFDPEKATAFGLRFLDENPKRNAPRYTEFVTRVMQNRTLLLSIPKAEVLQRAQDLIRRYPDATSYEKRRFLLNVDSFYGDAKVEKMLARITRFAEKHGVPELAKDVMLFRAECYLRKEQADRALGHFDQLAKAGVGLSSEDERRVTEYRALCYLWCREPGKAIPLLEELAASASQPERDWDGDTRTKAYYVYWHAVATFEQGGYAESKALFERVSEDYPNSFWAKKARRYVQHIEPLLEAGIASLNEGI